MKDLVLRGLETIVGINAIFQHFLLTPRCFLVTFCHFLSANAVYRDNAKLFLSGKGLKMSKNIFYCFNSFPNDKILDFQIESVCRGQF